MMLNDTDTLTEGDEDDQDDMDEEDMMFDDYPSTTSGYLVLSLTNVS